MSRWTHLHGWLTAAIVGLLLLPIASPLKATSQHPANDIGGRLAVPFVHQYYADASANDCGPSSVAMVLDAYGKRPTTFVGKDAAFLLDIRRKAKQLGPKDPVNFKELTGFEDLERVFADAAYNVPFTRLSRSTSTLQQIKDANAQRKPVIVLLNSNDKAMGRGYGGHWLVVIGFSADAQYVFVNDPDLRTKPKPLWNKDTPGGQARWPVKLFEQALQSTGYTSSAIVVGDGLPESAVLPPQIGAVSGTVRNSNGTSVAGATVVVSSAQAASATAKTNASGAYAFQDLPSGDAIIIAIKGNTGGTAKVQIGEQSAGADIVIAPPGTQQIVLPTASALRANFVSTGSPGDQTACSGTFDQQSPAQRSIYPGYLYYAGLPTSIGIEPAGTELVFSITPTSFCAGTTFFSTDSKRALILQPDTHTWIICWEDYTDSDFNDLVVRISLLPQALPFLQLPFDVPDTDVTNATPSLYVDAFFDHEFPTGSATPNDHAQYYVTSHGDDSQIDGAAAPIAASYDGNEGTNFHLSLKTPVHPAAPGTVVFAGKDSFSCAPLRGTVVSAPVVKIRHENGYVTEYWGLTTIAAGITANGAALGVDAVLGSSGKDPCTLSGTERVALHFVVRNPGGIAVDPFGWQPRATSAWYGLDDPWQQYHTVQDRDVQSYPLWQTAETISQLINPSAASTLSTVEQHVSVAIPTSAFNGPVRLELSETNAFAHTPFLAPLRGFTLSGFTTNEEVVLNTRRPLQITVMAAPVSTPAGLTALNTERTPTLYRLDRTSNGLIWTPIDTTWDPTSRQARANITELGTFVLADFRYILFLPIVARG